MGIIVNLTRHLEELVRSKVASGPYTSVGQVVGEAALVEQALGIKFVQLRPPRPAAFV